MRVNAFLCFLLFCPTVAWTLSSFLPQTRRPTAPTNHDELLVATLTARREVLAGVTSLVGSFLLVPPATAIATIDVNNAMAREFTAFPGLYPTVATKIVNAAKEQPFTSKKEVYAVLNEMEQERLRQYDKSIIIAKPDRSLQQFKTSQICKYECGSRTSSSYRDEQIRAVQAARSRDY